MQFKEPPDPKTWDKEIWLENNPVDYIQSVKIINCFPNGCSRFAFEPIYKISRLYLPDILYKFYALDDDQDLNTTKIETLRRQEVYLSELSQYNDPYDGRALFYYPHELERFAALKEHKGRLIDDFASFHIGTSLSANNYMNMPMWAHYSNNHRGYCVSYKKSNNNMLREFAFPTQYINARIDVTDYLVSMAEEAVFEIEKQGMLGEKEIVLSEPSFIYVMVLLDNIKGIDWANENEFRLSLPKMKQNRYVQLKPDKIYIGMDCDVEYETTLLEIARNQNIPAYKMHQGAAEGQYKFGPTLTGDK